MDIKKQRAVKIAKSFVRFVDKHYKKIGRAYLFGSLARGRGHSGSDIDVALISRRFKKDAYQDQIELMKLKTNIYLSIEPHPFHPSNFVEENPIVWEIKQHGILIK